MIKVAKGYMYIKLRLKAIDLTFVKTGVIFQRQTLVSYRCKANSQIDLKIKTRVFVNTQV